MSRRVSIPLRLAPLTSSLLSRSRYIHVRHPLAHIPVAKQHGYLIKSKCVRNGLGDVVDPTSVHSGFDLGHSIVLAGCSFEAYINPDPESVYLDYSSKGTTVAYTDADFVRNNLQGVLNIHLKHATNLPNRDCMTPSDPYVHLSIGQSSARSATISDDLNPKWNEEFAFHVEDLTRDVLSLRVFDADLLGSDDPLGAVVFPIRQLQYDEITNLELELFGDGGGGRLSLSLHLKKTRTEHVSRKDEKQFTAISALEEAADQIEEVAQRSGNDGMDVIPDVSPTVWKALALVAGRRAEELYDPTCFIDNIDTDTQVWVYRNESLKECVVAFRGTEQSKLRDFFTDADTKPAVFDMERSTIPRGITIDTSDHDVFSDELFVHRGFLVAYDSVRNRIFDVVRKITSGSSDWTVYTTGHSLGGALSTLCAFELASRWRQNQSDVKSYTFGSPRVGNKAFVDAFGRCVKESWRVVSRKDLVTMMPRLDGYRHVDRVVAVDEEGALHFHDGEIVEHSMEEWIPVTNLPFVERGRLEYDVEFTKRIIDGTGLEQHLEPHYLSCLRCCARVRKGDEPKP